jgi:simple sugar transport system permease protein
MAAAREGGGGLMGASVADPRTVGAPAWLTPRRVGAAGIALGVLAFFVALPPLLVRTPVLTLALALLAVAAGAWAVRAGERRIGWGAVVAGVVGAAGGWAATRSGVGNLERVVVWSALFAATLRYATPLLFAAIGGLYSERSGVINIGLEGMMLMGAFFAALGADQTGSWLLGLVIGMLAGGALALVHALFTVSLRADQIVSGVALNFLALGITGYLFVDVYGTEGTPDDLPAVPDLHLPLISEIPFVGDVLGDANLMVWGGLVLVAVTAVVVFRTPAGLRLRSAGENPLAAETAGLSVMWIRYRAVVLSGILAAAGGAYLSIGFVHSFGQNMTDGRGFLALAALIAGRWRPGGVLAATLVFGFSSALAQRLPVFWESGAVLFQALPYLLTLIVVAGVVGRSIPPLALGRPLERG